MENASTSCFLQGSVYGLGLEKFSLNDSQFNAVSDIVSVMDNHSPSIKLLWGPPGTGKTKTISMILWAMLIKGRKTLACAPTNTAVLEVAARIVKLVGESSDGRSCFLNDIILFGNKKRMKIDHDNKLWAVFLESRAERLLPCFMPNTGWRHCLCSLMDLLENPVTRYQLYIEDLTEEESPMKDRDEDKFGESENEKCVDSKAVGEALSVLSFKNYLKNDYNKLSRNLCDCIDLLYNDHPRNPESGRSFHCMLEVLELVNILYVLINSDEEDDDIWSNELLENKIEKDSDPQIWPGQLTCIRVNSCKKLKFGMARSLCVQELRYLCTNLELPNCYSARSVQRYLLSRSKCILCTVSSSFRLYNLPMGNSSDVCGLLKKPEDMKPLELLIIDEAAQVKECETLIPLQLPGIRQAVFIGDEYQLPALVKSKVISLT